MSRQPAPVGGRGVSGPESRDAERHPCELPTTCQPPMGWGTTKEPWPAIIRGISTAGLNLALERRFERGTGLAIELPAEDGTTSTVLARVIQIQAEQAGGWVLGCAFVSQLSDEEVQSLLEIDQHRSAGGPETDLDLRPRYPLKGVLFQAALRPGEVLRWYIKQLELFGSWPLDRGKIVRLQLAGASGEPAVLEMKIRSCRRHGSCWVVNGRFLAAPTPDVLATIGPPPPIGRPRLAGAADPPL